MRGAARGQRDITFVEVHGRHLAHLHPLHDVEMIDVTSWPLCENTSAVNNSGATLGVKKQSDDFKYIHTYISGQTYETHEALLTFLTLKIDNYYLAVILLSKQCDFNPEDVSVSVFHKLLLKTGEIWWHQQTKHKIHRRVIHWLISVSQNSLIFYLCFILTD